MTHTGVPDTYEFKVDTTTSYYHEGLYVECNAVEAGKTGYLTSHGGAGS